MQAILDDLHVKAFSLPCRHRLLAELSGKLLHSKRFILCVHTHCRILALCNGRAIKSAGAAREAESVFGGGSGVARHDGGACAQAQQEGLRQEGWQGRRAPDQLRPRGQSAADTARAKFRDSSGEPS